MHINRLRRWLFQRRAILTIYRHYLRYKRRRAQKKRRSAQGWIAAIPGVYEAITEELVVLEASPAPEEPCEAGPGKLTIYRDFVLPCDPTTEDPAYMPYWRNKTLVDVNATRMIDIARFETSKVRVP